MTTRVEAVTERDERLGRLWLAGIATAASIAGALLVDLTRGPWRTVGAVAASAFLTAALAVLVKAHSRTRTRSPLSLEYVILAGTALVGAVVVLDAVLPGLAQWRYTAAAATMTAPNWYVIAANLFPPASRARPASPLAR